MRARRCLGCKHVSFISHAPALGKVPKQINRRSLLNLSRQPRQDFYIVPIETTNVTLDNFEKVEMFFFPK